MKSYQAKALIEFICETYGKSGLTHVEQKYQDFNDGKGVVTSFTFYSSDSRIGHIEAVCFVSLVRLVIATYEAKGMGK